MKRTYRCLSRNEFLSGSYALVPIRDEDKNPVMQWRNEQIDILRQREPLTAEMQEKYFRDVISKLFLQEKPGQLLFSFLENGSLIGYGGFVHVDWESKNAEISFLTATERTVNKEIFRADFQAFILMMLPIAFEFLSFIKVHVTFYDVQKRVLYKEILESYGFVQEARLSNHILIDGKMENVLIYSCFNMR